MPHSQQPNQLAEDASQANSKKLDTVLAILQGNGPEAPGLMHEHNNMKETLYGVKGSGGVVSKVNVMWRIHMWILCSLSGIIGYAINEWFRGIKPPHLP